MTDFVFQEHNKFCDLPYKELEKEYDYALTLIAKFRNYAEFLKQPLTLGMFVPCDADGNVFDKTPEEKESNLRSSRDGGWWQEYYEYRDKYQEAKDRVLFEGFELSITKDAIINNALVIIRMHKDNNFSCSGKQVVTIEDLVKYDLVLTESAKKQIGL